jgi:hypothetical protein
MVADLTAGRTTSASAITSLLRGAWFSGAMAPNARLYWAYFGRIPDHAGLVYWADQYRRGTSLAKISQGFARSTEFRNQYGSLDDSAFVGRVYANVLERSPSARERAYWVGELGRGKTRGAVMTGFSESAEYKAKVAAAVDVVLVYAGMLRRSPTASELASDGARSLPAVIDTVRWSDAYGRRVG